MQSPILVTGPHYSGSTWVGKMLSISPEIGYIHEPFNPNISAYRGVFEQWYTYICTQNERFFKESITECLEFKHHFFKELSQVNSIKDAARVFRDKLNFIIYRSLNKRPLVKDPISLFSAEWLYKTYDMEVVILIRHPAAFVGSIKKKQATFPFKDLLHQPLLINKYLKKFEEEIERIIVSDHDIIDEGILLWNIFHHVILTYQKDYQNRWLFLTHEKLSKKPIEEFGLVFKFLSMNYSRTVKEKIAEYSSSQDSSNKLKRKSESNIWSWKDRLNEEEISRVREHTNEISREFYTSEDW